MEFRRVKYDDVAWEISDEMFDKFRRRVMMHNVMRSIGLLVKKHRKGTAVELHVPVAGSFNVCFRMSFADGGSAIIRFPIAGVSMLPEEKTRAEVAAQKFVADNTSLPVPFILYSSKPTDESPGGLGPFIIMEHISHTWDLSDVLKTPGRPEDERHRLDPEIASDKLTCAYKIMANILLQLSRASLPRIGSLSETSEYQWSVTERPLTFNVNSLLQVGDFPPARLPTSTFATASSYYQALAQMHVDHLDAQLNDAVFSETDCRLKYVARHLFLNLANEGKLDHFPEFENGPFKLFNDDLRPANVLVHENLTLAGVVDWEWTIAAPAGFAFSPPWWLLIEHPVRWPWGLDDWERQYVPRLNIFLDVLKAIEDTVDGPPAEQRLSARMKYSWDSGAFWVDYAARGSWAFDLVWFARLDEKFFGRPANFNEWTDWLASRLPLLTEEQREGMEPFVQKKMAQKAKGGLVDDRFTKLELPPYVEETEDVPAPPNGGGRSGSAD